MSTTQATTAALLLSKKQAMFTNEAGVLIGASWYVSADKNIAIDCTTDNTYVVMDGSTVVGPAATLKAAKEIAGQVLASRTAPKVEVQPVAEVEVQPEPKKRKGPKAEKPSSKQAAMFAA